MKINSPFIAQVAAYYPPHLGGMERVAKTITDLLVKRGHIVGVFCSDQGAAKKNKDAVVHTLKSMELAHTPIAPTLFTNLLRIPTDSIIHLHLSQAYFPEVVLVISKLRHIPYIVHFHLDVGQSGFFGPLFLLYKKIFWKMVLQSAARVIACSQEQASLVHTKFGVPKQKIIVIPNGVSNDFFSKRTYKPSAKQFRLLYVGRLAVQKRVDRLIEAMAHLSIPAHLTIVGDGEDRAKLEALVHKLGLTTVSFEGMKNDSQMQAYHRTHDALVISSDKEGGTALVVLEAMAAGLPILAANTSGLRELVDGVGILVNKPYPISFARAIEKLWKNPHKLIELAKKSKEKATDYSWEILIKQVETVYLQIQTGKCA